MTRTARERARDAVLGAIVADAAAAGLHWIYDVDEVRRRGGATPEFRPPPADGYHAGRSAGDGTHYGDHARVALESLVGSGGLDPDDYRARYVARFGADDYDGYLDHATKELLASGRGADDNQAGCLAKLPALVARYRDDPGLDARVETAVRVTHDHDEAVRWSIVAARALRDAVRGEPLRDAVERASRAEGGVGRRAGRALDAAGDHVAFAVELGQSCPVPNAVPVALHAALSAVGFEAGVRAEILAGGDSAGRLLLSGALLGAAGGVPEAWLARLPDRERLERRVGALLDAAEGA